MSGDAHREPPIGRDSIRPPETLSIERIVTGGDGIARHGDGRVVFVPRTAPGDVVEVEYVEEHRQWLRARPVRVLEPGPHRREPSCPWYASCGGCQLQHIAYEAQLRAKQDIVADSLRRLGKFEIDAPEIARSPREFGYRNRITLVLRRHAGGTAVGYHSLARPSELVTVDRCPLAEESINTAWPALQPLLARVGDHAPRGAEWRLTFRADSSGRVGLAVEGAAKPRDIDRAVLEGFVEKGLCAVWMVNDEGRIIAHAGEETLAERWGSYEIPLAGTAFLQVNREAAAKLEGCVIDRCGAAGVKIVDAYCGFGVRAFALAERGSTVVGIDSDRHAVRAASQIGLAAGLPVRFVADRVERIISQELPSDVVILNPPRAGVEPEVVGALLGVPPARVVYVSCNPATLARDMRRLSTAFTLEAVEAFDLFPQTAHVETVATLVRSVS